MFRCKHCGLPLAQNGTHAEGPQRGKNRCAVEPYGYDAAPEGEECSFACLGSLPNPPSITKVY